MRKLIKMLPYLLIFELAFLLMPLIGIDTGGLIFLLFIIFPIVCLLVSVVYGILNQFFPIQLLFPLFVGILFTVTFYLFSQEIVWIYTLAYIAISLAGNGIGYLVRKLAKRSR